MDFEPMTLTDVEASVYYGDTAKDNYFVKITFVGIGLFINSFSVKPSNYGGYWVQPPKHYQRKGYTETVDFDKKQFPLWETIERKAIEAVELYKEEGTKPEPSQKDTVITDIDDSKPITLDDIPW